MYKGRINRKAFVLYSLGLMGMFYLSLLTLILCAVIFNSPTANYFKIFFAFVALIMFILFLLSISGHIAIAAKRLHDINLSGWWILLYATLLIPLSLTIELANKEMLQISTSVKYLMYFFYWTSTLTMFWVLCFTKGDKGTNTYGPNPLQ